MKRIIVTGNKSIEKILSGVKILSDAVSSTLGPEGKNVVIQTPFHKPHSTKDGITVAEFVVIDDHLVNTGATMVKQAASKTALEAGDGTTTSTILAYEMIKNGFDFIKRSNLSDRFPILLKVFPSRFKKINVNELKRGMLKAQDEIVDMIKALSTPIYGANSESNETDRQRLINVATISSNNDKSLGELIGSTMSRIGLDGQIKVEDSGSSKTSIDDTKGYKFDKGNESPYLVNSPKKNEVVYENALILLCDTVIEQFDDVLPVLEYCMDKGRPILIIAEDIVGDARSTIIRNVQERKIKVGLTTTPAIHELREELLKDISSFTGARIISEHNGELLKEFKVGDLGSCDRFVCGHDFTTIFGFGDGNNSERQNSILSRVESIDVELQDDTIDEEKRNQLKGRKSKLLMKAVTLKVGASTDVELKEKMDRIDDAIRATRSSMEEGIVPGAGSIYKKIYERHMLRRDVSTTRKLGEDIVYQSLISIHNTLFGEGNEARNILGSDGDLMSNGVIDAAKVIRSALENAVSVASTVLTTNVLIVDVAEENDK